MTERRASIRLGTTGKAQVKADFAEIADSGDAAAKRWARAYERASDDATAALQRQSRAADKIAAIMPQTATQMRINDRNGTGFGQYEGSAKQSASVFRELAEQEAQLEARTRALLTVIDPAWAAQRRYNAEVREAAELHTAGRISIEQFTAAEERAALAIERVTGARQADAAVARTPIQTRVDAGAGTGYGDYSGSARQSADAFRELLAVQEQSEARARSLIATVDPLAGVHMRVNAQLKEAKELYDGGYLSAARYQQVEKALTAELHNHASGQAAATAAANRTSMAMQQLNYQAGDVIAQLASGTNPAIVFAQQASQITYALSLLAGNGGGAGEGGGAGGAADAIGGMTETLGGANDAFDATTGAAERLTGMMGGATAATEGNAGASATNATAHEGQAAATTQATTAAGVNTAATNANTTSTEANAVATTGAAAAKMRFVGFLTGPWGAAVIGGITLLGILTTGYLNNGDAAEDAEAGMKKFQDRQSDIGNFIDDTTGRLKEQNRTLVLNAILTRQAQIATNEKAVTDARDKAFEAASKARNVNAVSAGVGTGGASLMSQQVTDPAVRRVIAQAGGDVDKLAASLAALAKHRPELKDVALEVSSIGGRAILAARENEKLGKELRALNGDSSALAKTDSGMIEAKAKLAGAVTKMDRAQASYTLRIREADAAYEASNKTAADQARLLAARTSAEHDLNVAQEANRKGGDRHAQSLARQASAMEVNADAALDLARAYLTGGDAALKAEAARKGLTDATKKGIDGDAQVARELAIMVGDQLANGAKSLAQLRDETAARAGLNAQIAAGALPVDQLNQALSDEAALRPLLKLQTVAQGEALTLLTKIIGDYRQTLAEAHAEEANSNAAAAIDATKARVAEIKASILDMASFPEEQAMAAARRAAEREADAGKFDPTRRKELIDNRVLEAQADARARQARYILDTLNGQEDSLALAQRELDLVGANDNYRSAELEKLKLALDIRRQFPGMAEQDAQAILQGVDAQAVLRDEIDRTAAAMDELRGFGTDFVDTVLDEDTWKSWGDAGSTMLNMLKSEFIKLALLNPLRNMINGDNKLTTLTGLFSSASKLFGGSSGLPNVDWGGSAKMPVDLGLINLPKNAAGTEWWSGGMTLVGEHGPELVDAPRGARIGNAGETRRLLAANDGVGRGGDVHNHFNGNMMTTEFWAMIQSGDDQAAARGAAGGAALGQANGQARVARRLGRGR